jgi:hypothetical protein
MPKPKKRMKIWKITLLGGPRDGLILYENPLQIGHEVGSFVHVPHHTGKQTKSARYQYTKINKTTFLAEAKYVQ